MTRRRDLRPQLGTALLLHASEPVEPLGYRHGTVWTTDLAEYLRAFTTGRTGWFVANAQRAGIPVQIVRVWPECTRAGFSAQIVNDRGWVGLERYCPICLDVPVRLLEFYEAKRGEGACYLLHFDAPIGRRQEQHYVGYTTDIPRRFAQHRYGRRPASRSARQAKRLGVSVQLGKTWFPGSIEREAELKTKEEEEFKSVCRICQAGPPLRQEPPTHTSETTTRRRTAAEGKDRAASVLELDGRSAAALADEFGPQYLESRAVRMGTTEYAIEAVLWDEATALIDISCRPAEQAERILVQGLRIPLPISNERLAGVVGALELPAESRPGLRRALTGIIGKLQRAGPKGGLAAITGRPSNMGRHWTEEDDERLVQQFEADPELDRLARAFGRTRSGVRKRLRLLGKLD